MTSAWGGSWASAWGGSWGAMLKPATKDRRGGGYADYWTDFTEEKPVERTDVAAIIREVRNPTPKVVEAAPPAAQPAEKTELSWQELVVDADTKSAAGVVLPSIRQLPLDSVALRDAVSSPKYEAEILLLLSF